MLPALMHESKSERQPDQPKHATNSSTASPMASGGYADAIVRTVRQPLLVLNGGLRVRFANDAFYAAFAVSETDTVGVPVYELGNGQWDIPSLRTLLEDVLPADTVVTDYEVDHDFPDIGRKIMTVNARRLIQPAADEELVLLAIEDITEREETKRTLETYSAELERSNRDLEQFAYVASHDLQEPLRTIRSFAELLDRRYKDVVDDKGRQYLDFMTDAASRMQRLVKDLLVLSRVTRTDESSAPLDLEDALRDALSRLDRTVDETGAEVTWSDLPTVVAQPSLIVQIFQNLIANAVRYRSDDAPRVHVSAHEQDGMWRIDVTDNGIGIDPRYHERIFDVFQRLHPGSHSTGSGIGLSLCRRIVEHHGGRIWVTSTGEHGSTFSFTLPARTSP